ncbi:MAG: sigma 54-interacting transcriptional regulator [candidate division WOR-3 bacterium]
MLSVADIRRRVEEMTASLCGVTDPSRRLEMLSAFADELRQQAPAEAEPFLVEALGVAIDLGDSAMESRTARILSEVVRARDDLSAAIKYARQALAAARVCGKSRLEGAAYYVLAAAQDALCDYNEARSSLEQAREAWELDGYKEGVLAVLHELGRLYLLIGQPGKAEPLFRECLAADEQDGVCQYNLGLALVRMGRWEDAVEPVYRAVAFAERAGFVSLWCNAVNVLGEMFLRRDKPDRAVDMFRQALEAARGTGASAGAVRDLLANLGLAHMRRGDLAGAAKVYEEAMASAEAAGDRRALADVMGRIAELALVRGDLDEAEQLARRAEAIAAQLNVDLERAEAVRVQGGVFAARDDVVRAGERLELALKLLSQTGESYEAARVRLQYGQMLLEAGQRESGVLHLKAAAKVFRQLGVVAEAETAHRLLFRVEMLADGDMALLQALSGLATLGLDPGSFLERAMRLLREALHFDCSVICVGGRPVLIHGTPRQDIRRTRCSSGPFEVTPESLRFSVMSGGVQLGNVHLEREVPDERGCNPLVIQTVASLLAGPLERLRSVPQPPSSPQGDIAGLRYRGVIGRSAKMLENLRLVARVAGTNVPVLIRGESGTGKELIARALHESGPRSGKPFVAINCAAMPENLLEAEFFGVEKGTATGVAARRGKFETADGGTVFLDEVGDMSHALQAKLLRVLQDKQFERVGGRTLLSADVRIVAATNQILEELMKQGGFRTDLYYRLNAIEIFLPPLRERREDIPDLVRSFIAHSSQEYGRKVAAASEEVMRVFLEYSWPGNIRELQNVVERAVVLAEGSELRESDLPPELRSGTTAGTEPKTFRAERKRAQAQAAAEVERARIVECLENASWNVVQAAVLAGYSRAQFYRLMRKHGITRMRR